MQHEAPEPLPQLIRAHVRPSTINVLRRLGEIDSNPDPAFAIGMMTGMYVLAIEADQQHKALFRQDTHERLEFPPQLSDEPQTELIHTVLSPKIADVLLNRCVDSFLTHDPDTSLGTIIDEAAATANAILTAGDESSAYYEKDILET